MTTSMVYLIFALAVLAVIAVLFFIIYHKREEKKLSLLAGLGFAFIIAGILFGNSRLIGYGLIGVGVFIAVIDMIVKLNKA